VKDPAPPPGSSRQTEASRKMTPEELMRKVTEAFAKGDLKPLFDAVDDDTVWKSGSVFQGIFRFGGEYKKCIGVFDVALQITTVHFFRRFEPIEIVSHGDVVWGLFDVESDYLPTSDARAAPRPIKMECALRWRVRNGKIVEHQSFFDTAGLLIQQGEFPRARVPAAALRARAAGPLH
jgi:ketosteroid isomerase-like protein